MRLFRHLGGLGGWASVVYFLNVACNSKCFDRPKVPCQQTTVMERTIFPDMGGSIWWLMATGLRLRLRHTEYSGPLPPL